MLSGKIILKNKVRGLDVYVKFSNKLNYLGNCQPIHIVKDAVVKIITVKKQF